MRGRYRHLVCLGLLWWTACAPVMPLRQQAGGAARWALAVSLQTAAQWDRAARLCRVQGIGVGNEGWLPDRGGTWVLTFWSPQKDEVLEISVATDGRITTKPVPDSPYRSRSLPRDWVDSPRAWSATRPHQQGTPLSTFESELAIDAAPERYPGRAVWRIRFFLRPSGYETHVVDINGDYLVRLEESRD